MWPEIVRVRCGLPENKAELWVVGNSVQGLFGFVPGHTGILVTQTEVQREARSHFPIVLREPVNSMIIVRREAASCASQRPIRTIRYEIVDERIERRIVPFAAGTLKNVGRSNVIAEFGAHF